MAGIDRTTGGLLSGWPHVEQSLTVLITTALGSRFMRRNVGSTLPRLVDSPVSPATLVDFYAATAATIERWEPRFKLARVQMDGTEPGSITITAEGIYYPRGHLGDRTVQEPKTFRVQL